MKLNVSYCSADDYGAYLLWITIIVLKDVYKNKGNKDPRSNSHHHEILILSADLFINCSDLGFLDGFMATMRFLEEKLEK